MLILNCSKYVLSFVKFAKLITMLIRIAAPILLIISSMRDFASAVKDSDSDALKKASLLFVKKMIITVLIFLIPTFVLLIADWTIPSADIRGCYESANVWSKDDKDTFEIEDPAKNVKCNIKINKNGTTTVDISGAGPGSNYSLSYGGETFNTQKGLISLNGIYKDVQLTVNGSATKVKCNLTKIETYDVVAPPSGANIVASSESDTLKIKVEKKSGHYLSYIWVMDPYKQFNKIQASNYGSGRESLETMLKAAIAKYGTNRAYLATNASGFYVNGTWTPNSVSYNDKLNFTQEGGLVITDGKVVRNWYYDAAVDRARNDAIYGINPQGMLVTFKNINNYSEEERKKLFQSIIDSGIRNTVTFRPVLIENGNIINWGNDSNTHNTTAFCQINRNNFILYSSSSSVARSTTVHELKNLGCLTAVNFDGGGSVSLLFQPRGGNIQTITGGSRTNVEVLFVTD